MIKIRYTGGELATKGSYWDFSAGQRVTVLREEMLPGSNTTTYFKASPLLMLAAGPVLGLIYAAFLPFIGLAIVGKMVLTRLFSGAAEGVSKVATFNWQPTEAYLAGKRNKDKKRQSSVSIAGDRSGPDKK